MFFATPSHFVGTLPLAGGGMSQKYIHHNLI